VRVFLSRFIAYPREHAKVAHVLWIVRAHLMRAADAVQAQGQVKTVSALIPPQPLASPRAAAFIFAYRAGIRAARIAAKFCCR